MDSLTQIVLGAACGEALLGKKIGNKALLFGAIGGTIPDLDVFTSRIFYSNEIDIMAAHRGFSHSIVFSILGAYLFGWLVHKLYDKSSKRRWTTSRNDWIKLFFWSLFTHIILDAFTPYGTQWFLPFSEYRVAFNNISVADPLYTVPFLLCMIVLMFFNRTSTRRQMWLKFALGISSFYMLLTIGNKFYIDSVFKSSLKSDAIVYERFSAQPTILNNILWYGIAETKSDYRVAFYSLLDKEPKFSNWQILPKNHEVLPKTVAEIKTLDWFSNGYYNLFELDSGRVRFNDLRYPLLNADDPSSSVFSLKLYKKKERWDILPFEPTPPKEDDLKLFINRIKGIK
ncbi:metal-dependent hydrolase [Ichthyenterobacterium sp. W332]|uniref:Metal-dependent hydrolase n=1 Tax=Microcosmobacter mediterraneus TaxID=3075607 RepID=A0ABU2YLG0_9FLAO|nr:metal-dependent hydrolase [Ichthyenterobacterium sp. W332]MDT0558746.1 metal-dependent hydrolase [Ichthyenterobacterium sp. W332]